MQDLVSDLVELDFVVETMEFSGLPGNHPPEKRYRFLELLDRDPAKIDEMQPTAVPARTLGLESVLRRLRPERYLPEAGQPPS